MASWTAPQTHRGNILYAVDHHVINSDGMSDNELIAEFMGWKKNDWGYWVSSFNGAHFDVGELQYHKSWDWLMPVVEKIETMYDTGIFYDGKRQPDVHNVRIYAKRGGSETIVISYGKSKIETTYNAVVEFIKWYNQQKQ